MSPTARPATVLRRVPYTIRRTIGWGECDPAGIVYTPRFLDFCVEAAETWFADVTGWHWNRLRLERDLGSPVVRVEMDFIAVLAPEDRLDLTVRLGAIGRSSHTLRIAGHDATGRHCFQVTLVSVLMDRVTMKATPIPDDLRAPMVAYLEACDSEGP